jgi:hypothetical protein
MGVGVVEEAVGKVELVPFLRVVTGVVLLDVLASTGVAVQQLRNQRNDPLRLHR